MLFERNNRISNKEAFLVTSEIRESQSITLNGRTLTHTQKAKLSPSRQSPVCGVKRKGIEYGDEDGINPPNRFYDCITR